MKAAFSLLCISTQQRSQSAQSIPRKALSVPQLLHSGIRGYSEVPQKPLLPNLPDKLLSQLLPAHVGPIGTGEPKPPPKHTQGTTPSPVGQQAAGFGTAQLLRDGEGLFSTWNTLRTVPSSILTLQDIFVFIQYHLIDRKSVV